MWGVIKFFLAFLVVVLLFVLGIVLFVRFAYSITEKNMCVAQNAVDTKAVLNRIQSTNLATDQFIAVKITTAELQAIINDGLKDNNVSVCVKTLDKSKIGVFIKRNPFVWTQVDIITQDEKPYMKVDSVHWDVARIPGLFEPTMNSLILAGYKNVFEHDGAASRKLDKIELDGDTIILYSNFQPQNGK